MLTTAHRGLKFSVQTSNNQPCIKKWVSWKSDTSPDFIEISVLRKMVLKKYIKEREKRYLQKPPCSANISPIQLKVQIRNLSKSVRLSTWKPTRKNFRFKSPRMKFPVATQLTLSPPYSLCLQVCFWYNGVQRSRTHARKSSPRQLRDPLKKHIILKSLLGCKIC